MATPDTPAAIAPRRSPALLVLCAVGASGLLLALMIFFGVGRWLVAEDPLGKASAIVVLSGAMPMRALEAATLYRDGYAPEVWLTHSTDPAETLEEMDIPFTVAYYHNARVF